MKESIIISLTLLIFGVFSLNCNSTSINIQVADNQSKEYKLQESTVHLLNLAIFTVI